MNTRNNSKGGVIIFAILFTLCASITLIYFVVKEIFGVSGSNSIPDLPNLNIGRIIAVFLLILAINITVAVLSFIIARKTQWGPILWLNKRLFSTVKKKKEASPKLGRIFKKFSDMYNPERLVDIKQQDIPYGTFLSEPEEEFITPEHPFFYKSWMAYTLYDTLFWAVKNVLIVSVISAFFTLISSYFLIFAIFLSITIFILQLLYYWKKEWLRFSEVFFITNYRFGYVKGQFSWAGLLFSSGVDISFKEYTFTFLGPTYVDPIPDNIKLNPILEFFIETLAKGQERVGTLKLHIIGYGKQDEDLILDNFSYAPYIKAMIDKAKGTNEDIREFDYDLGRKSRSHIIGTPGRYIDIETKQSQVEEWQDYFHKEEPKLIDIFQLVRIYIEKLANAKIIDPLPANGNYSLTVTNEDIPITIDPNRFPGKEE